MTRVISVVMLAALVAGCGVNVQTSSGDTEQRSSLSSQTASDLRSDWAARLAAVDTKGKAVLLTDHIERVGRILDSYAAQIVERWHEGNVGRGTPIPDTEMRSIVSASIKGDQPMLEAYDDMIEYAYTKIKEPRFFDSQTLAQIQTLIDDYNELYSLVLYPTGSVDDYQYATGQQLDVLKGQIMAVRGELERY